jgi:hypothetical protein
MHRQVLSPREVLVRIQYGLSADEGCPDCGATNENDDGHRACCMVAAALAPTRGGRPRLSPAFLSGVVEDYMGLVVGESVTRLAELHGVDKSTASRWLTRAREEGLC